MELKLHYLRSTFYQKNHTTGKDGPAGLEATTMGRKVRTHDSAVQFLYGENNEGKFFPLK